MKKWLVGTMAGAAVVMSMPAAAGGRFLDHGYYDYARVMDVDPIIERVRIDEPKEMCWTEDVTYRRPPRPRSVTPEIVGVIVGGVVGNQFGSGRGKDIATVAGCPVATVWRRLHYARKRVSEALGVGEEASS